MPSFLFQSMDFWFEADTLREISNMTRVHDDHYRTSVHPLFSLLTFIPVYIVKAWLTTSPLRAVLLITGVVGGLWTGTLYACCSACLVAASWMPRSSRCSACVAPRLCSGFRCPTPIPGDRSRSCWPSCCSCSPSSGRSVATAYVIASALTLSFTVTNWMAGSVGDAGSMALEAGGATLRQCVVCGGLAVGRAEVHLSHGRIFYRPSRRGGVYQSSPIGVPPTSPRRWSFTRSLPRMFGS